LIPALVSMTAASLTSTLMLRFPESMSSVTPYAVPTHDRGHMSFPENYWSMTGPHAQSYRSDIVSREISFPNTLASDVSAVVPIPSNGKFLSYCEALRNRVLTDYGQPRSITGEPTRAGHQPAHSMP